MPQPLRHQMRTRLHRFRHCRRRNRCDRNEIGPDGEVHHREVRLLAVGPPREASRFAERLYAADPASSCLIPAQGTPPRTNVLMVEVGISSSSHRPCADAREVSACRSGARRSGWPGSGHAWLRPMSWYPVVWLPGREVLSRSSRQLTGARRQVACQRTPCAPKLGQKWTVRCLRVTGDLLGGRLWPGIRQ